MSVKTVGRSGGRSATGAAAYRSGERIECERYGIAHDYTRKQGVEHCEIFLPHGAPRWARERSKLWNTAEQKETRKNSTVAREFELALPHELNNGQRIELVKSFSERLVHRHRMAVDACIHAPDKHGNSLNHHAHILCTTRRLSEDGFTEKTRELDKKDSGEVDHWREVWADMVNEHLQRANVEARVDHRTLKAQRAEAIEQGDQVKAETLNYEPTIHEGAKVRHMSKRNIETNRAKENAELEEAKVIHLEAYRAKQEKQAEQKDLVFVEEPQAIVAPEPVEAHPLQQTSFDRVPVNNPDHAKEPPVPPAKPVADAEYDGWSDQSVLDIWEDLKSHERGVVQNRAQRLQSKTSKAIEALQKQQAAHEREKPQKGLLDRLSKRTGYKASYEAWKAVRERLQARYKQLLARLKAIGQYVGDRLDHKGHNLASQKAEQIIRDRVPVFAGRVQRARLNRQKETVEVLKEKSVQRAKTIKKRMSYSMSDPNDPHALSEEQQRQKQLDTLQEQITKQQEIIKNQRSQLDKQDATLNQQAQQLNALSPEYQKQDNPNQSNNQQPNTISGEPEKTTTPRVGQSRAIRMTADQKTAIEDRNQMNAIGRAESERKLMQTSEGRALLDKHYENRPDLQKNRNTVENNHSWAQTNHPEAYASYMSKQKVQTSAPVSEAVSNANTNAQLKAGVSETQKPAQSEQLKQPTQSVGSNTPEQHFEKSSPQTQKNFTPVSVKPDQGKQSDVKGQTANQNKTKGEGVQGKTVSQQETGKTKTNANSQSANKQSNAEKVRLENKAKIMAQYKERQKQHSQKQQQGKGQKV